MGELVGIVPRKLDVSTLLDVVRKYADIMMHTMERYFVLEDTMEITDKIAQDIMKNVMKYAKILKKDPENYEARAEIM